MKSLKQGLLIASMFFSGSNFACLPDGSEGFLPENNLRIPVNAKSTSGITEEQFNLIIDQYEAAYAPIIANLGAELKVNRKWESPVVNASAQQKGKIWIVSMFGGLARHETITPDGFALVVCHELGHHIAGAPLYSYESAWGSTEGQSDYFATTKCLRRVWQNDDNRAIVPKMEVPQALKDACGRVWSGNQDYNICIRGGMAGASVADLFAALNNQPPARFETPDTKIVTSTYEWHPVHQCRLDTYFQGALCEKSFNEDFSRTDEVAGSCHGSTGHAIGGRPFCWFKPSAQ